MRVSTVSIYNLQQIILMSEPNKGKEKKAAKVKKETAEEVNPEA